MRNYLKQITVCILLFGHTLISCSSPNVAIKEITSTQEEVGQQQVDRKAVSMHEVEHSPSRVITNKVGPTVVINKAQLDQVTTNSVISNSAQSQLQVNQLTPITSVTATSRSTDELLVANSPTKKRTNRKGISLTNKFLKSRKELQTRQATANRSTKIEASIQQSIHPKYANSSNVVGVRKSNVFSSTDTSVNSELMGQLAGKLFTAKNGHLVTFKWNNDQWVAVVKRNLLSGSTTKSTTKSTKEEEDKKYELRAYLLPDMTWEKLATMSELEQQYRIRLIWKPNSQDSHVIIGKMGLMGGGKTGLHRAIWLKQIEEVNKLIAEGADINAKDEQGDTPLHLAVDSDYRDIITLLISKGANKEVKNNEGNTPLHVAVLEGYIEVVRLLLSANVNKEAKNDKGDTPLHIAANCGFEYITTLLLSHGANKEAKDDKGDTPLHIAANCGFENIATLLLSHGANKEAKNNKDSYTPLHMAAFVGHKNIVALLISHGADKEAKTANKGYTPLNLAAYFGHKDVVALLISQGANKEAKTNEGATTLHIATSKGHKEIVALLLSEGVNKEAKTNTGKTSLHLSIREGNLEITKYLVERGADLHSKSDLGLTPIDFTSTTDHLAYISQIFSISNTNINATGSDGLTHLQRAMQREDLPLVKKLIDSGANKNEKDLSGNNLVHFAIQKGDLEFVKYLVEQGTALDAKNADGLTPIDLASTTRHVDYIQPIFLVKSTNINAIGNDGSTHLHRAIRRADMQLASLLIELGANIKSIDGDTRTSLHLAAEVGHRDLAKQLVEKGADMHARDKHGMNPLHTIAFFATPCVELAVWLVKKGLDINLIDNQGNTALHLAIEKGHIELATQLLALGADPYIRNKESLAPLHLAFQTKQLKWIKQLLQQPGLLPLHWAIRAGDLTLMKQLIELKADLTAIDQTGWTGLHWAAYEGNFIMVKYLIEEAHMLPSVFDKQGKTPLDIAIEKNYTEMVAYLREVINNYFRAQRERIEPQLTQEFKIRLTELLKQIEQCSKNTIQAGSLNPANLAIQWLDMMRITLQREWVPPTLEEETPELHSDVEEFLQGFQEGLQQQAGEIPENYREELKKFSVESLRPYAAHLVKQWHDAHPEKELLSQNQESTAPKGTTEAPLETQKEKHEKEDVKKYSHLIDQKNLEKRSVRSSEHAFIAASRAGNMRRIRSYIDDFKEDLAATSPDVCLRQQKEDVTFIFKRIQKEQQELKPLCRALKAHVEHRGADSLFLEQDTSEFNESQKEKFEQESNIIQKNREYLELARKLLIELQAMKEEVCQILKERNENLTGYVEES